MLFTWENILYWSGITTISTIFIGYVYYTEIYRFRTLKNSVDQLQIENTNLKNSIKDLKESIDLEVILDDNINHWNFLLARSLFDLYSNNGFKEMITFTKNDFNERLWNIGEQIQIINDNTSDVINKIFSKSEYVNYYTYNQDLVEFETKIYFSKLRFLITDTLINDMILENHPNAFFNVDGKPNLIKVLNYDKIVKPYSLDVNYIKSLTTDNSFIKPKISKFE